MTASENLTALCTNTEIGLTDQNVECILRAIELLKDIQLLRIRELYDC